MSIFQKSVRNEYLKSLDETIVAQAYSRFQKNFNIVKIEEIKKLKEEEYQDGFLRDIFVDVFGYTFKPEENYNLAREYKNVSDSKKADGAILKNGNVIAVIELKSAKTKDLNSIKEQAFNYKNEHQGCKYVITSNFQKIRLYVEYSNEFEEFDLFDLSQDDFKTLYLLLNKESVFNDIPSEIKQKTIFREENISKQLYKDYSSFKKRLFENLVKNNPEQDKLTLFKKSQKLIDRFLFILFAEDRGLLPSNSISRIIQRFETLKNEDAYKPIYDIFKQYFGYMNVGREGKNPSDNIPAYNGGLFYEDNLLDKLIIDDDVLKADLLSLSVYDFNTDVDVNILGHIFEHSLSEIEEITAEIEGIEKDKSKSKRKKDGVFYTPKYITQYIVENTIGTLCTEKRKELNIFEIEFDESFLKKDRKLSKQGLELYEKLEEYKKWLLSLKIVDPACGSGAFLNQALNFLISEHQFVIDMETELQQGQGSLFSVETAILENNLYGVDINEESVEIAKLSLWLRTAQKGRKLSILSNNIKCGNSLIDDPEVAGDKAFNWEKEFPEVFANGGFDVVIGNPPYGDYFSDKEKVHLQTRFEDLFSGTFDMYIFFYKIALEILKSNKKMCFITPQTFTNYSQFTGLRKKLAKNNNIEQIIILSGVFKDAIVDNAILLLTKNQQQKSHFKGARLKKTIASLELETIPDISSDNLSCSEFIIKTNDGFVEKLINNYPNKLGDLVKITQGITTGGNEYFINTKNYFVKNGTPENLLKKMLKGKTINKYQILWDDSYIIYSVKSNQKEDQIKTATLLSIFKDKLSQKRETKNGTLPWYCLHWARNEKDFNEPKILIRQTADRIIGVFDNNNFYPIDSLHTLNLKFGAQDNERRLLFITGIINSCLINYLYSWKLDEKGKVYPQIKKENIDWIPIPEYKDSENISIKVKEIQKKYINKELIKNNFYNYISSKHKFIEENKTLKNWTDLDFGDFLKKLVCEINKTSVGKLTKMEEMEWMELFEAKKAEVLKLKEEIDKTDKEIDKMVYELYGLTEEEIEIVEGSL